MRSTTAEPRCRSISPVSCFLQSQYQDIKQRKQMTTQLQSRKSRKQSFEIDSATASAVVSQFLIPVFERNTKKKFRVNGSTFYSELKLSQKLNKEKEELIEQSKFFQQRYLDMEQAQESMREANSQLQSEVNNLKSALETINFQYVCSQKQWNRTQRSSEFQSKSLQKYQEQNKSLDKLNEKLNAELQEEKAKNDRLNNQISSLQHEIALLTLGNTIIGERLKGLYNALYKLMPYEKSVLRSKNEMNSLLAFMQDSNHHSDNQAFIEDSIMKELMKLSNVSDGKIEKVKKLYSKKIQDVEADLCEVQNSKNLVEEQFYVLMNKYKKLEHKLWKLQNKETFKICKNCQGVFNDDENYNWSCKVHRSVFSGQVYFCCGSTDRDAPGCFASKHQSYDETHEVARKHKYLYCSSCRENGHSHPECPKDPNIRGNFLLQEEVARISKINDQKQKFESIKMKNNIRERMLKILNN